MIHKISIIKYDDSKVKSLNLQNIKHKFLYDSLYQDIKYIQNDNSIEYVFFDAIHIIITSAQSKEELEDKTNDDNCLESFYGYYFDELLENDEISQYLRNSSTLTIDETNSYDSKNMKVVFSENGFLFSKKRDKYDLTDTFDRVMFLFSLSIAINTYTEILINEVTQSFIEKDFEKMIKIRDDIYSFDVRCFFNNPIKINRHETFNLWNLISENYHIKLKYDEMKSQISDLANIIEVKQKNLEEIKNKKFEKVVAVVGTILALTSLLGVYMDLKELGVF